jgi:hypothetical protein
MSEKPQMGIQKNKHYKDCGNNKSENAMQINDKRSNSWMRSLQQDSKAQKHATEERGKTKSSVGHEDRASTILGVGAGAAAATTGRSSAAETGDGDLARGSRAALGCARGARGGGGGVALEGALGTAGVVLAVL